MKVEELDRIKQKIQKDYTDPIKVYLCSRVNFKILKKKYSIKTTLHMYVGVKNYVYFEYFNLDTMEIEIYVRERLRRKNKKASKEK